MLWTRPVFALAAITHVLTTAVLARAQTAEQGAITPVVPAEANISKAAEADSDRTPRIEHSLQARSTSPIRHHGSDGSRRDAALWRFRRLAIEGWPTAMGFAHGRGTSADVLESCESAASPGRDSWKDHDRLAQSYAAVGDTKHAIACYEKSLALNPDNESGLSTLTRLQNLDAVRQSSLSPHR
jgi:tetratricopeptide (TPR) repeat protein